MWVTFLLLVLVNVIYNITFYTVLIHKDIYSLAWAPDMFLVSYLLIVFTNASLSTQKKWCYGILAGGVTLLGTSALFSYLFTHGLSGIGGYLINDIFFVLQSYGLAALLKQNRSSQRAEAQTQTHYLLEYFALIGGGVAASFTSVLPLYLLLDLPLLQVQQLFLGNLLAFFLFGVPVFFLWVQGFNSYYPMYIGQALITSLMVLSVFWVSGVSDNAFHWLLWCGMFFTLLWRSSWCQMLIFGFWGPLITQEFALKDKIAIDYVIMLLSVIFTQVVWFLFLYGDLQHQKLCLQIKKQEKMLNTDFLTGCLNRKGFFSVVTALLQKEQPLTLGTLDLNHFKAINDTLGHESGDRALQIVANRLAGCVGGKNRLARLGGDEFAFVLIGDGDRTLQACQYLMGQVYDRPIVLNGQVLYLGISLGVSHAPQDGSNPEILLKCADMAMYTAKRRHSKEVVAYQPSMVISAEQAVAFFPYPPNTVLLSCYAMFQPVYHAAERRIRGVEALVRHPQISTVALAEWAEQSGQLDALFNFMLEQSLPVIGKLRLPVSLNISPTQLLAPEPLLQSLKSVLAQGVSAHMLSLEITETVQVTDAAQFQSVLKMLRELGVKISLDDFGAGFAFFETLHIGYFDTIKLDRSLITDIHLTIKKQKLVQSIVHYAGGLGIAVVAEGIEVQEEALYLRSIGIELMQGYYFFRPLSWEALNDEVASANYSLRSKLL